jgi:Domain of unknown function (DUF4157)
MSDAAFRRGGSTPSGADVSDPGQSYVPRAGGLFGGDRMDAVNGERDAAAAQIQRSLKAWRKAKDDEAAPGYVPKAEGGRPLATDVRKRMEPRLGADLSSVRVHDSAGAADKLGARAFTVGSDVHFNAGEYNPGTKEGDRLIAHELTHVVQGQKAGIQRKPQEGEEKGEDKGAEAKGGGEKGGEKGEKGGAEVSDPAEPAEKEADAKADEVAGDLHEGGDKKKDDKKDGKKDEKDKGKGGDKKDGKHAKDAANDADGEKKKGGGAEGGPEAKGEAKGEEGGEKKGDDVKQAAPSAAAKLKVFRVKSKADKQKEIDERKKLLTAKVELAAKSAERIQKIGEFVASFGIEALAAAAGPAYPALAPILKELVPSAISIASDTKREIDAAVLSKAISTMTNSQLKKLENSLNTKEPSLGDLKTAVGKRTFDLQATAMAGGPINYAKEGLKNIGKEGAKKGLLEVLKHIAEKIVPFADAINSIREIVALTGEIGKIRGEIEELEKAV